MKQQKLKLSPPVYLNLVVFVYFFLAASWGLSNFIFFYYVHVNLMNPGPFVPQLALILAVPTTTTLTLHGKFKERNGSGGHQV